MADLNLFSQFIPMADGKVVPPRFATALSSPPFHFTITLDLPTSIIMCISVMLFFLILAHILHAFFQWLKEVRPGYDLEEGEGIHRQDMNVSNPISHPAAFYQAIEENNVRVFGILDRFMRDVGERRGQRLRASKKLPTLVNYGSHGIKSASFCSTDCAICLEDFAVGDSCQVFPVCNHIFHSNCIDHWLRNKITCPVCRNCVL
ncbi:hypothetical protein I3760_12G114000 [Carya illinoinensis]|nr:hypothetical protein I3760_12G114000 [Carya illinoinensis]